MPGLIDLHGRVAVVTGGASGLGLAMARRFAHDGMRVVLADVEHDSLKSAAEELAAGGAKVHAVVTDVAHPEELERLADETFGTFGAAHVLCNNAGVVKSGRAWKLTLDDWNWVLGVDLFGVVYGIQAFVPRMLAQGEPGHIVNTSSVAGILPMPNLAAYAAAKAGVVAVSESLQLDLEAEGAPIGVSVLCPGWVPTRILESERNRPETLDAAGPDPSTPRSTTNVTPTMDADGVASLVADAVRTGEFWILTHPKYREVVQARAATVGTPARPVAAPVW
jgi:NAD(P)-dependent dehydrogenase (short-subunit alcohol dehydrogenase family)